MKKETAEKILVILWRWWLLDGGIGITLSQVSNWSGVPRSTTYRYLKEMCVLGLVNGINRPYRNKIACHYTITMSGRGWLEDDIPF